RLAQNGPPGWASRNSASSRMRNTSRPALICGMPVRLRCERARRKGAPATKASARGLDRDLLRLGLRRRRNDDPQHALVERGLDLFGLDPGRQLQRAGEGAIAALDEAVVLVGLFALDLLLAADGEKAVAHGHVDVLLLEARQFDGHLETCLRLRQIHAAARLGCAEEARAKAGEVRCEVLEQA